MQKTVQRSSKILVFQDYIAEKLQGTHIPVVKQQYEMPRWILQRGLCSLQNLKQCINIFLSVWKI